MRARYDAIFREIRDSIEAGMYPYQGFLPSEAELTKSFSCSHNTLRRALALLRDKGYVQPVHGKGVRVIYRETERTTFTVGDIETFREAGTSRRLNVKTKVITIEPLIATQQIAFTTGFAEGEKLTLVERVRYIDDEALIFDRNLFLSSEIPGITKSIAQSSIYNYIENTLGVTVAMSKRAITVEQASEKDQELLNLQAIDYVAVLTSQVFNDQGVLFEFTTSRHRPDHFCFRDTAVRQHV